MRCVPAMPGRWARASRPASAASTPRRNTSASASRRRRAAAGRSRPVPAGAYTLLGQPRRHDAEDGTWKRPTPEADSAWGAWELAGRYSAAELRNGPVLRGGAQRIWTAGLNWYPTETLAVMLNYQNGILRLDEENRRFQAIGLRLSFSL
ncbi:porin [Teichococcus aestuarii]|uniref:porin n=1 Tax=Teichococcus aestuarii TaxID=568898 RepID=UPI00361FB105